MFCWYWCREHLDCKISPIVYNLFSCTLIYVLVNNTFTDLYFFSNNKNNLFKSKFYYSIQFLKLNTCILSLTIGSSLTCIFIYTRIVVFRVLLTSWVKSRGKSSTFRNGIRDSLTREVFNGQLKLFYVRFRDFCRHIRRISYDGNLSQLGTSLFSQGLLTLVQHSKTVARIVLFPRVVRMFHSRRCLLLNHFVVNSNLVT